MDSPVPQKYLTGALLSAFFPEVCLHCGENIADAGLFCAACSAQGIKKFTAPQMPAQHARYPQAHAFVYEGVAKSLLKAAKFSDRRRALQRWIDLAAPQLLPLIQADTFVLALPSRRKFLKRLLKAIVPKRQLLLHAYEFKREKFLLQRANKSLGEAARYRRIHDTLQWKGVKLPASGRYVICDDVFTTGATLNHAGYLAEKNLRVQPEQIALWALLARPREFTFEYPANNHPYGA